MHTDERNYPGKERAREGREDRKQQTRTTSGNGQVQTTVRSRLYAMTGNRGEGRAAVQGSKRFNK